MLIDIFLGEMKPILSGATTSASAIIQLTLYGVPPSEVCF